MRAQYRRIGADRKQVRGAGVEQERVEPGGTAVRRPVGRPTIGDTGAAISLRPDSAANRLNGLPPAGEGHPLDDEVGVEDVAAVFAHDLRGPVRTARLLSERLLSEQRDPTARSAEIQMQLVNALDRVDRLIASMVEYGNLLTSPVALEPTPIEPVVEGAFAALLADLDEAGGSRRCRVEAGLEASAQADLLGRVLQNLIANSIKYRRDDVPVDVTVTASRAGRSVHIAVADNGEGIPPHLVPRAMQVMERLHPHKASGLGFGLAICRRIVEGMGGRICIVPRHGPGTTVVLTLDTADQSID